MSTDGIITLEEINAAIDKFFPDRKKSDEPAPTMPEVSADAERVLRYIAAHGLNGETYHQLGERLYMDAGNVLMAVRELIDAGYLKGTT